MGLVQGAEEFTKHGEDLVGVMAAWGSSFPQGRGNSKAGEVGWMQQTRKSKEA